MYIFWCLHFAPVEQGPFAKKGLSSTSVDDQMLAKILKHPAIHISSTFQFCAF